MLLAHLQIHAYGFVVVLLFWIRQPYSCITNTFPTKQQPEHPVTLYWYCILLC